MIIKTPDEKINNTSDYIRNYWGNLKNAPDISHKKLPLKYPYITPSKEFNSFFYWDVYFEILGLIIDDEYDLAKGSVKNFIYELAELGFIPNYNGPKGYSSTRSQPPFLSQMVIELYSISNDGEILSEFLQSLINEYKYWNHPPKLFKYNLSRYYDTSFFSKLQPFSTMAESGWDFTNRFKNIKKSLPIDLNVLLVLYGKDILSISNRLKTINDELRKDLEDNIINRINFINEKMWDNHREFYYDYSTQTNEPELCSSLAGFFPMWGNLITFDRAECCAKKAKEFQKLGGFVTTLDNKIDGWWKFMGLFGLQWSYPVGWAPLQWIVNKALCNYNYDILASETALLYLTMIAEIFDQEGCIFEKYDVVEKSIKIKAPQYMNIGFGWTNSIFQVLLARIILGIEPNIDNGFSFSPRIPKNWKNKEITANFMNYPKLELNLSIKIKEKEEENISEYFFNLNKEMEVNLRFYKEIGENCKSILINNEESIDNFKIKKFNSEIEKKKIILSKESILLKSGLNQIIISYKS
ncbi:MAG: trehalase family glycosidase [Promethearchaeota archaeon]